MRRTPALAQRVSKRRLRFLGSNGVPARVVSVGSSPASPPGHARCHTSDHETGSAAGAKPGSWASPVNGGEVRDTWFFPGLWGYDVAEVDDLLARVAAELDAGRRPGPLIENVRFRVRRRGYDIDAVDWFLGQLLSHPGSGPGLGEVAQLGRNVPGDLTEGPAGSARRGRWKDATSRRDYFRDECWDAWRDFGHQPGTRLCSERAGWRRELRSAEQQTIASLRGFTWQNRGYGQGLAVSAGGRSFTFKTGVPLRSSSPDIAEIAARSTRDTEGHFAAKKAGSRNRQAEASSQEPGYRYPTAVPRALVDETGTPILYASGDNHQRRADACITFPNRRWLRFLVRGTTPRNAIMTAVNQIGNRVARYRISQSPQRAVEIIVPPDRDLTDELVLAIAISAPWLRRYFKTDSGGGG
jgi:DivIVA domain-containing protein